MQKETSRSDFRKDVLESMMLSIVQFKTEWSGACQIIEPVYKDLARSYKGNANFYTVDVEKNEGLEKEYGIMELPTILFFKGGQVIDYVKGLVPKNVLISKIESALTSNSN